MRIRTLGLAGMVVCFASLAGCGGESSTGGNPGEGTGGAGSTGGSGGGSVSGPIAVDDLPGAMAAAMCDYSARCYPVLMDSSFTLGDDCVAQATAGMQEGNFAGYVTAIEEGRTVYDGEAAATCVRSVQSSSCESLLGALDADCDLVFSGTLSDGASCMFDEECAAGLYCSLFNACPGVCTARGGVGDPCESETECAEGLGCAYSPGECVTPLPLGAACTTSDACVSGAYCGSDGVTDTCQEPQYSVSAAEGEVCGYADRSVLCAPGLYCVADPGQLSWVLGGHCEATPVPSGGACRSSLPEQCPTGEYCAIEAGTTDGTCQARPGEGQPCTSSTQACAAGLECVDGTTCLPLRHLGEGCQADGQCFSEACDGVCVTYDPCRNR